MVLISTGGEGGKGEEMLIKGYKISGGINCHDLLYRIVTVKFVY